MPSEAWQSGKKSIVIAFLRTQKKFNCTIRLVVEASLILRNRPNSRSKSTQCFSCPSLSCADAHYTSTHLWGKLLHYSAERRVTARGASAPGPESFHVSYKLLSSIGSLSPALLHYGPPWENGTAIFQAILEPFVYMPYSATTDPPHSPCSFTSLAKKTVLLLQLPPYTNVHKLCETADNGTRSSKRSSIH